MLDLVQCSERTWNAHIHVLLSRASFVHGGHGAGSAPPTYIPACQL